MREGKILNPEKLFFDEKGSADIQLDCKDSIIAPGFIDVQINGIAKPHTLAAGWGVPGLSITDLQSCCVHTAHYQVHFSCSREM